MTKLGVHQDYTGLNDSDDREISSFARCIRCCRKAAYRRDLGFDLIDSTIVLSNILSLIVRLVALIMLLARLNRSINSEFVWLLVEIVVVALAYLSWALVNYVYAYRSECAYKSKFGFLWVVGGILYLISFFTVLLVSQSNITLPTAYYLAILVHLGIIGPYYAMMVAGHHSW
jgi:hypothetical protein